MDLHSAVAASDADAVRALLATGADLAERDHRGRTPLEVARHPEIARLLISAGAPVQTSGITTPLHRAVAHGWPDVAELLLERGADPGSRDEYGDLPLDLLPNGPSPLRDMMASRLRHRGRSTHLGLDETAHGPHQRVAIRPHRAEAITTMYRGTVLVRWELEPAIRPLEIIRTGRRAPLHGPAAAPGATLLAFSGAASLQLRQWATVRLPTVLPPTVPPGSLALSPEGDMLAIGADEHLWIVDPYEQVVVATDQDLDHGEWEGLGDTLVTPRFSADGTMLAVANTMRGSWWLSLLDVAPDGRLRHRFDRRDPQPWSSERSGAVEFSPDGALVVMWVHPDSVLATHTATGNPAWAHRVTTRVGSLCFTGDGRTLALGTDDGVVWLDAATGKRRGSENTFGTVYDIAYAEHTGMLAATSTGLHRLLG